MMITVAIFTLILVNLPINLTVLFALLVMRRLALLLQLCLLCCLITVDIYFFVDAIFYA